jgi:hypothetical protein
VRALIAAEIGAGAGDPITDWTRIETVATAARVADGVAVLVLEQLPGSPVPALVRNDGAWVAGPLDADGWRLFPPLALRFLAEGGVVRLRVTAAWSPWGDSGTTEHGFLAEALRALPAAGFLVEPFV